MSKWGNSGRLRTGAVVVGTAGALALTTGCGVKDKIKGDGKNKGASTGSSAPKAGAAGGAPGTTPAAAAPKASTAPGSSSKPVGGPVTAPGVCDVLPADAVTPVVGTSVVAQPDDIPFTCDYRGPDGKAVLSTTRTLNTVFKPGDDTAPIDEAVTKQGGTRIDAEVGAPAAVYTRGSLKTLVLTVKLDDKNFLKVTITPEGTAKALDQAKLVTLAKAVITTAG
ncbi:hypothetical protein OG216_39275 [Streptomycetaceae bacterium NBC_01309]